MEHIIVTLIHGTWAYGFRPLSKLGAFARKALWFENDSDFRHRLVSALRIAFPNAMVQIETLEWSGRNSIIARFDAAKRLREQLQRQVKRDPSALKVIIGHSHGGSIATLAIKDLPPRANIKTVTISTPFLEIHGKERLSSFILGRSQRALRTLITLTLSILIYNGVQEANWLANINIPIPLMLILAVLCLLLINVIVSATLQLMFFVLFGTTTIYPGWLSSKPRTYVDTRIQYITRMTEGVLKWNGGKILVIRGIDDEAFLAITGAAIGNSVLYLAYMSMTLTLFAMSTSFLLAVIILLIYYEGLSALSLLTYFLAHHKIVALLPLVLIIGSVVVLVIGGLCRVIFGKELLLGMLQTELVAHSCPDTTEGGLTVMTITQTVRGLRHSLHREPEVPGRIAEWLRVCHSSETADACIKRVKPRRRRDSQKRSR